MHVAMLSSVHPALDMRIYHREAKYLAARGHRVTLIVPALPTEALAHSNGIAFRPVWKAPARPWRWITVAQVFLTALRTPADVYHFHDPELLPVGWLLARLRRASLVVYDVHEDFPQAILNKYWIDPRLRRGISRLADRLEKALARRLHLLVHVTEPIYDKFRRTATPQVLVKNYPPLQEIGAALARPCRYVPDSGAGGMFRIGYAGGLAEIRGVNQLIEAVAVLIRRGHPVECHLAGPWAPESYRKDVENLVHSRGLADRVFFHPVIPYERIWPFLQQMHVGVIPNQPLTQYEVALARRLFDYMAAGLPVVTHDFGLGGEFVRHTGVGLTVNVTRPEAIADGIEYFLARPAEVARMGARGQRLVREQYNWESQIDGLIAAYEQGLARLRRRGGFVAEPFPGPFPARAGAGRVPQTR